MPWITASDVKLYAQVKYSDFLEGAFADEAAFDTFITGKVIPAVESHIEAYCDRDFDTDFPSGIPEAIKDIARRAGANILQYMVMNKMGPLIRTGDFKLEIPEQEILTPGLRKLLDRWKYRQPHVKSTEYEVIDES